MDHREDLRSDAELVQRALAGEEHAFTSLVLRHFNAVYLTAYARLADRDAAEDLAQEVFLRAHLHLKEIADGSKFPHWVCRVSRNLAIDWRRRSQTASRLLPLVPMDEGVEKVADDRTNTVRERLERRERERAVQHAILELPSDVREIVLLHYVEGLSERDIAARLGVHRTTVRYHLKRGLERFRTELSKWLPEAANSLRPNRVAAVRAAGIAAAAAAMSASSKSALAAAAQATSLSTAELTAPAAEIGRAALLKSSLTGIGAGAVAMAHTKIGIAVGSVLAAALLAGGSYELAAKPGGILTPTITIEKASKPSNNQHGEGNPFKGRFEFTNVPGRFIIALGKQMPPSRVVWRTDFPNDVYDVKIENMFGTERALDTALGEKALKQFGLAVHKETITTDVLIMKNVGGGKPGITAPTASMCKEETARIKNKGGADLSPVRGRLENLLHTVVLDETGITGKRSYDLRWHANKPESIVTSLKKQMGIDLVPGRRQVEVLVVDKAV